MDVLRGPECPLLLVLPPRSHYHDLIKESEGTLGEIETSYGIAV